MDDEGMEIIDSINKKKLILPNGQTPPTSEDSFVVLPDDSPSIKKDDSFSTVETTEKAEPKTPENEQEVTVYYTPANGADETEDSDSTSTESPAPSPILINHRPIENKKAGWLYGRVLSTMKCLIPCI